jgi:hypothetical protein
MNIGDGLWESGLEYRALGAVETRARVLKDGNKTEVVTQASHDNLIGLEYEAGTTGEKGGDWGHGSRVYLRLEKNPDGGNGGGVGWKITASEDKVEIILGGDWEIAAIKSALRFMLETLEEQTKVSKSQ